MKRTTAQVEGLPSALIQGYDHSLGQLLAQELIRHDIQVQGLVSSKDATITNPLPESLFDLVTSNRVDGVFDYLLLICSLQGNKRKSLDQLEQLLAHADHHSKVVVVITDAHAVVTSTQANEIPSLGTPTEEEVQSWETQITSVLDKQKIAKALIIYPQHLYGELQGASTTSLPQTLFSQLDRNRILLVGKQDQKLKPLYERDAVKTILTSLFRLRHERSTVVLQGKHEELLINLAFAVQNHIQRQQSRSVQIVSAHPELAQEATWLAHMDTLSPTQEKNFSQVIEILVLPEPLPTQQETPSLAAEVIQMVSPELLQPVVSKPRQTGLPTPMAPPRQENIVKSLQNSPSPPATPKTITKNAAPLPERKQTFSRFGGIAEPQAKKSMQSTTVASKKKLKRLVLILLVLVALGLGVLGFLSPFLLQRHYLQQVAQPTILPSQASLISRQLDANEQRLTSLFAFLYRLMPSGSKQSLSQAEGLVKFTSVIGQARLHQGVLAYQAAQLLGQVVGVEPGNLYETNASLGRATQQAYQYLSQARLLLPSVLTTSGWQEWLVGSIETSAEDINQSRSQLHQLRSASQLLPLLLPADRKVSYLVLMQNSLELRPTGGFIEEVGLATFDRGKLLSFNTISVYELDQQLRGRVDPPEDLQIALGEEQWFLRDVNWDPDFITTARNASWFYEKQRSVEVDGVVGLTIPALEALLEASGQVSLADGTQISAATLRQKLFDHQISPTDRLDKPGLFGQVTQALLEGVKSTDLETRQALALALFTALDQNNIQVYSNQLAAMRGLVSLGWGGEVINPTCPASLEGVQCLADSFHFNEANVAVNLANNFVRRSHNHGVVIEPKQLSHTHAITLTHTGSSKNWPGGDYQLYARSYLPAEAELASVLIDGVMVAAPDLTQLTEHEKKVIGTLVSLKTGESTVLTYNYTMPHSFNLDEPLTYTWFYQKQAGTDGYPLTLKVSFPATLNFGRASHSYALNGNQVLFTEPVDKSLFFAVELQP